MPKKDLQPSGVRSLQNVSAQPSFLQRWADSHRSTFEDCMERLADELPQKYAELYLKIMSMQQPQPAKSTNNIDTLNVNVGAKLDALGTVKDTSWRNDSNTFTNYEEVHNDKH